MGGDVGVKENLVENITQFLFHVLGTSRLESFDQFIDLFEDIGNQGFVGLLRIPRASIRAPKRGHGRHQAMEGVVRGHRPSLHSSVRDREPQ